MHTTTFKFRPAALIVAAAFACGGAFAGDTTAKPDAMQTAQARFQQDKALCASGKSNQDQQTCLKEAGAAYEQARRGALNDRGAPYDANARKRCEVLPANDRLACLARMDGAGTKSGSEAAGGIYRELSVVTPAGPSRTATAVTEDNDQDASEE